MATKDTIIYHDTVIAIHDTVLIPGEIIGFDFEIADTNLTVNKSEKKNGLTGTVNINKGRAKFMCKQDSLQHVIDSLIVVNKASEIKQEVQVVEKEVYVNHWYDKPSYWIASLSLIYWLIMLVIFILKKFYGK